MDHIVKKIWGPLWWTAIGTPFARHFTKELKEVIGKSCNHHYRGMSKAAGVKKPRESRRAKALWAMKAAKDRVEDVNPARKDNILGRRQELWTEHLKDPIEALDKALKYLENQFLVARDSL